MNVFYFVNRWPKNNVSSRSTKILSMVQTLINVGYRVTLLSPDTTPAEEDSYLQKIPIDTVFLNPNKVANSIASTGKRPDLAIFNSYQMEQMASIYLYSKYNKCPRILEINQLKGLQMWRKRNYTLLSSPFLHDYNALASPPPQSNLNQKFEEQELQSIKRSDFFFCGNDYISHYLKKHLKINNYIINSLGLPVGQFQRQILDLQYRQFRHRKNFVYLGNLNSQKNIEMIDILINHIWPIIRGELSNVELHIFGVGSNKNLQARKKELQKKGIFIKGEIQNTEQIQKYKAMLYPVLYTTGTKGAIIQSWFQHTPVVTTPIGAEGLFKETSQPLFSANQKGQSFGGFFKEKTLTKTEQAEKKQVEKYYNENKLSDQVSDLNFGGICSSWSYNEFAKNAIAIHNNQSLWRQCLLKSRVSLLKHHSEGQMEVNIKYGISQVEYAVHQGRKQKQYKEEWDKYIKSKQGHSKLQQKRNK